MRSNPGPDLRLNFLPCPRTTERQPDHNSSLSLFSTVYRCSEGWRFLNTESGGVVFGDSLTAGFPGGWV